VLAAGECINDVLDQYMPEFVAFANAIFADDMTRLPVIVLPVLNTKLFDEILEIQIEEALFH
jgi:hypothetical protein